MKIPITPYGIKELLLAGGALALVAAGLWILVHPAAAIVPLLLLGWVISFFRDPPRTVPADAGDLVAPADGTVADITEVDDEDYVGRPALRIGIFLSVFNVHVNRAPCRGRVETVDYREGRFLDARNPKAGQENEALTMGLCCDDHALKVIVRQISGAIARRIVCRLAPGATVERGERYGMIKFGSRTELILPADRVGEVLVDLGSKVRAGKTLLVRLTEERSGAS